MSVLNPRANLKCRNYLIFFFFNLLGHGNRMEGAGEPQMDRDGLGLSGTSSFCCVTAVVFI